MQPGEVTAYLTEVDPVRRPAVSAVIEAVRRLVPSVTEGRSYGMPALMYEGKPLISVMATKKHLAIYPYSGKVVADVADRLAGFSPSTGTIRFDVDHRVPDDVLRDVVALRRREIDEPEFRRR